MTEDLLNDPTIFVELHPMQATGGREVPEHALERLHADASRHDRRPA